MMKCHSLCFSGIRRIEMCAKNGAVNVCAQTHPFAISFYFTKRLLLNALSINRAEHFSTASSEYTINESLYTQYTHLPFIETNAKKSEEF